MALLGGAAFGGGGLGVLGGGEVDWPVKPTLMLEAGGGGGGGEGEASSVR